MWPARDAICLDCRQLLPGGVPCPGGDHRVQAHADPAGRQALLREVWGAAALRRNVREAARVGAASSGTFSVLDGCAGCDVPGDGHLLLGLVVVFAAVFALWLLGKLVVQLVRRYRERLVPGGARTAPARFGRGFAAGTVVAAARTAPDPVGAQPCVAFGVELRAGRRGVMLRDGASIGFEVVLDSGERVAIPAGACIIDAARADLATGLAAYRARIALPPAPHTAGTLDPVPGTDLRLAVLRPGDRVELHGALVPTPDPAPGLYRDARVLLVPDGVPRLARAAAAPR